MTNLQSTLALVCFTALTSSTLHLWANGAAAPIDLDDNASLTIIQSSTVVADPQNQIATTSTVRALGTYKYSLDGSLVSLRTQNSSQQTVMKVVRDEDTGQLGLTNGQMIVSYTQQADPQDLANDYSLVVISEMASLRKFTVQISDFGGFTALEQQLRTDPRVLSTELDVSYAPLRPE